MLTSQQKDFLSEILGGTPIPEDKLVYFRERLRDRLHSAILAAFEQRAKKGFKQSDLAERINKKRAQIARWLSTTSNLTLDSISDLMVGLGMDFDEFPFTPIEKIVASTETKTQLETSSILAILKINENLHKFTTQASAIPKTSPAGGTALIIPQQSLSQPNNVRYLADFQKKEIGESSNILAKIGIAA
jgi:transcriptional regulator with XRE-family HTH domain